MTERPRYRVSGKITGMRTTYLCDSVDGALAAHAHLVEGRYSEITITTPDRLVVSAIDLERSSRPKQPA